MNLSISTTFCIALLVAQIPAQARLYVDAKVAGGGTGQTWSTAFATLPPALVAAAAGTEIWVATGSYSGSFTVPAGVSIYGGFRPGQVRKSERDIQRDVTTLDGGNTQRVLSLGAGTTIDGLVIKNGRGTGGGGGAMIDGTNPTVRACVFANNTNQGGSGSTLLIVNGAQPRIENSLFVGNAIAGSSHVIEITGSGGTYDHLVVADNVNNGIHIQGGSSPRITNSIFANNTGRGICDISASNAMVLENNLFWGNLVSLYFFRGVDYQSIAQVNALGYAKDNLAANPLFLAPASADYRIAANSPAREVGGAAFANLGGGDFWGFPRVLDAELDGLARTDIGAHEWSNVVLTMTGQPRPGQTLTLGLAGTTGAVSVLLLGVADNPLVVNPFGTLLLAPSPLLAVALGSLPAQLSLPIPAYVAGQVAFQGLVWQGVTGNLSNAIDITIR